MPVWIDVLVTHFDSPELVALLVSWGDRQFVRYRLFEGAWTVVEQGPAGDDLLRRAEDVSEQSAFKDEQIKTKVKRTVSPDGTYVLQESVRDPVHVSELKCDKRTVLLSVQTDQLTEGLRKIGEVFYYCGK